MQSFLPTINSPLFKSIILIIIPFFSILYNSISFNSLTFKCENYLLNVYLYYILLFGLFITSILSIQFFNIKPTDLYHGIPNYLILLVSIIMFFILTLIPSSFFITKHFILFATVIFSSLSLYGLVEEFKDTLIPLSNTIITLLSGLALFSYFFPTLEENTNQLYLAILGFILAGSHQLYLQNYQFIPISNNTKLLTSLSGAFIFFSIPNLALNANNCVNPDYINQILSYLKPFSS